MKKIGRQYLFSLALAVLVGASGCDQIYGLLHKAGGQERRILGSFEFNEYSQKVENLQKILNALGYSAGHPDGKFGVSTRETVARFQKDEGLEVTRFVDQPTWDRMQEYLNCGLFNGIELDVKAVQTALQKAGFAAGRPDGKLGPKTRQAVKDFQASQGLRADGYIGLRTIKALAAYLK